MSAEAIFSKPPSERQKNVLARIAKRQAPGDDSGIDVSDIPPLSAAQLERFSRAPTGSSGLAGNDEEPAAKLRVECLGECGGSDRDRQ